MMNTHICGNRELYTSRMMLALYTDDEDNYRQVIREIAGCVKCWEAIAHWAVGLVAGDRAFQAGGREQAAGYVLSELYRTLMKIE
jgi:hypothetical protein